MAEKGFKRKLTAIPSADAVDDRRISGRKALRGTELNSHLKPECIRTTRFTKM